MSILWTLLLSALRTYDDLNVGGGAMVFNVTFNNISAISWWSILLVEEPGLPGENY